MTEQNTLAQRTLAQNTAADAVTGKKVWFITGAGRGMGTDIAKAALAAGHAVVATGRNPEKVAQALGDNENLLAVRLDVTDPADAAAAIRAAVDRFGRIDVLVNNAGNFYAGFFEEISPEDFRAQIETTLFGPVNLTRAVLPVHAAPRGHGLFGALGVVLDGGFGVPGRFRGEQLGAEEPRLDDHAADAERRDLRARDSAQPSTPNFDAA